MKDIQNVFTKYLDLSNLGNKSVLAHFVARWTPLCIAKKT